MLHKRNSHKTLFHRISPLYFFIAVFFLCNSSFALDKTDVSENDVYADAFVTSSISDPRTLVPILASDNVSNSIVSIVFNGLVKYDKDLNLVGDLAYSWEVSDDGKTIIFYLRKNVLWHDGEPIQDLYRHDVNFER